MARAGTPRHADRMRAPRVQITYDLDIAGRSQRKELPFVVGVLGDFSGTPDTALPKLRDRRFLEVSRENFDAVLQGMRPRLAFTVDNKLGDDGMKLAVELRFGSLEDFEPERVALQVEPLRRLIEARRRLTDLRAALERQQRGGARPRDLLTANRAAQGAGPAARGSNPDRGAR